MTLRRAGAAALLGLALLGTAERALGAGMYWSERGVRPLARGGAFVAGADDLGAISYNPAGLADAQSGLLLDASWVDVRTEFTRQAVVEDSARNRSVVTFPKVTGTTPFVPIPTIAASYSPGFAGHMFTFAVGAYAPYGALSTYPETVDGQPSPSRYSLITLDGSTFVSTGAYVAIKPIEQLRFGAGIEILTGSFASKQMFSASLQDRVLAAPESPEYDALSTLKTKPFFAPRAHFGVTAVPVKQVRLGVAFQLPTYIDAPADLNVTLPRAPAFDNARQEGTGVRVRVVLPAVLRAGVEVRPIETLRIEFAWVSELWSAHRSIDITPVDVRLYGLAGFPSPFSVPPVSVPRNFRNSHSFRLGGEYTVLPAPAPDAASDGRWGLDVRAGVAYETSAVPSDYLTPLTADLDRVTLAVGAGVRPHPRWRIDVLYAHVFGLEQTVSPETAAVGPVNPVRGNPTRVSPVNGGTYASSGNVVGLGATVRF